MLKLKFTLKREIIDFIVRYIITAIVFLPALYKAINAQQWFDPNWNYRTEIAVDNFDNSNSLSDYQINIKLDHSNFNFTLSNPNGEDIRIANSDGVTLLPFWIENWNSDSASMWVKMSLIPANTILIIYLYHGNSSASSMSNGDETFLFFDDFENFTPTGMNSPEYLITPTNDIYFPGGEPDHFGQAVHPAIVFIPEGWNGYQYWMAMTPYPYGGALYENPSILCSNDNVNWVEPAEDVNPIVPPPPSSPPDDYSYNNDPELLLVNNMLILYFNETNYDGNVYLKRMESGDGINWSSPAIILAFPQNLMSPSLIYENDTYYLWYLRSSGGCYSHLQNIYLRESSDGIDWGPEQNVNLTHNGFVPWHFDIQKEGSKYTMIYVAYRDNEDCDSDTMSLYYSESPDGINWSLEPTRLLSVSNSGWDNRTIYRSTFLVNSNFLRIWYSARSIANEWHIGYTEGNIRDFAGLQTKWDKINGRLSSSQDFSRSGSYSLKEVGDISWPQIFKDMNGRFSLNAWYYDQMDASPNYLAMISVWNPENALYPLNTIGVGVWTGISTSHYVIQTDGENFVETSVSRTLRWHKLTINVNQDNCDFYIDNTLVGTSDVLDESNISRISSEGLMTGLVYFDDIYLRSYSEPDPLIAIGDDYSLPVELTSFIGYPATNNITLEWTTASEINNQGFIILRKNEISENYTEISSYQYNDYLKGAGNSNMEHNYKYQDFNVIKDMVYWYKLVDIDFNGLKNENPPIQASLSSTASGKYPNTLQLFQSYPNPFNNITKISFYLPEEQHVLLRIFDIQGKEIETLLNIKMEAGLHTIPWDASRLNSGVYFYQIQVRSQNDVRKCIFIK